MILLFAGTGGDLSNQCNSRCMGVEQLVTRTLYLLGKLCAVIRCWSFFNRVIYEVLCLIKTFKCVACGVEAV